VRSESPPLHSIVKYALIITEIAGNLRSSRLVDPASRACPPTGRALALTDRSGFAWHELGPRGASHRKAQCHASDRATQMSCPVQSHCNMTKGKPSTVRARSPRCEIFATDPHSNASTRAVASAIRTITRGHCISTTCHPGSTAAWKLRRMRVHTGIYSAAFPSSSERSRIERHRRLAQPRAVRKFCWGTLYGASRLQGWMRAFARMTTWRTYRRFVGRRSIRS
jgi:hypothetical protein